MTTTALNPHPTHTTDHHNAIEVRGLRRSYGTKKNRFEAVRGIDFEVQRGQLFALLGTNGAGKTSTLEVLEGIAPATSGSVRVLGLDPVKDRDRVRHRTGVMLQEAGFPDELTVADMARMWHGTLTTPRPVDASLAEVELSHRAHVRISALSGGEKRRLDLALATMGRPEILFLDEPTTGLDPESRNRTWSLVRGLLDEGTTVVLTTHYLPEAESLADRIAIMHRGEIARYGTVEEIVAAENAHVSFLHTPHLSDRFTAQAATLPGALGAPEANRQRLQLETTDLQTTLYALLRLAEEHNLRLDGLEARSASLEHVFLSIAETPEVAR